MVSNSTRQLSIIGLAVLQCFSTPPVFAATVLPTNGQVAAGSATISQPNAQTLQINQTSQNVILNWDSFSISADGTVNFLQPGSSSVALNRVLGGSPSEIFGRLTANGQIFLVNPSGVLFGRGASVDVGGLAASTLAIKDSDFLAGRYVFAREGAAGSVVNQGTINAPGGYAALIGPNVANEGLISARMGSVALAAGDRVTLDMIGDGLIRVQVDQAALGAAAINRGTLAADGGQVIMTARSADALLDTVLNNEGVIRAHSLVERNGSIYLDGGSSGVTSVSGTLDASGRDAGLKGGTVTVLGDKVGLFDNARIDVSGDAGGGTALIGGNFQGQGPERNANAVFMGSDVLITADALSNGNGGKVVLWSDGFTSAHGTIYARGGAQSGDGGLIETSGHQILDAAGMRGGAGASNGAGGSWLFDPDSNVDITTAPSNGVFLGGTWTPTLNNSNILNTDLNAVLNGGTNVTVTTTNLLLGTQAGNITVSAPITNTAGGARTLTLSAGTGGGAGSVTVNDSISATGANSLAVNLNAGTGGAVSFGAAGSITTLGGNIQITSSSGGVSQAAGSILNSGAGAILVNGGGGAINMFGALTTTNAASAVTIQSATTAALGNITANSGTVTLGVGQNITGALTQNAATAISANTLTASTANSINLGNVGNANTIANLGTVQRGGALTINDTSGGLTLTGSATTGTTANAVSITTAGGALALGTNSITGNQVILQGTGVTQATGSAVNANAGTILVNGAGGAINLAGALTTTNATGSAVTIRNATTAALGNITATSGGVVLGVANDISGALTQTGGTAIRTGSLATSTANSVALTSAGNDFTGVVSLANTGANAIQVTDINAIMLGTVSTANNLTVNAVGITQNAGVLAVGGASSFNAGAGAITLTQTNDFTGAVSLSNSGANNVAVTDANAIVLGTSSVGQNLAVTAGGNITQNGALTVPGASTFTINTAAGQDVLLGSAANNFAGTVTIANGSGTVRDVALRNTNAAAVYPSLPGGLRNLSLQFNNAAMVLAATGLSGNLAVTAGGAITQSGALSVAGASSFDAGAHAITLTNAGNDFSGAVSLNNSGANNVAVTDANAIVLGTSNVGSGMLTVTGASSIMQTGAITQAAAASAASFTTGAGAITLTQANDFTGAVSLNNSGANNVAVTDANAIVLGTSSVGQNLAVTAGGNITQSGALTVPGTSTFTMNAINQDVLLGSAANNFAGAVTIVNGTGTVHDVELRNTNAAALYPSLPSGLRNLTLEFDNAAMVLAATGLSGNLAVTAGGAITQSGALSVNGTSSFDAGAHAITLTMPTNNFTGAVSLNNSGANNVAVTDANAIQLGTSNVGQNLAVAAGGHITQSGALTVSGAATFTINTAADQDVMLGSAANSFGGAVTFVNGTGAGTVRDAALRNTNAAAVYPSLPGGLRNLSLQFDNAGIVLPTTLLSGDLAVTAGGTITQSGTLTVLGTSTFNAGANAITLTTPTNDFQNAVSLAGGTTAITDANALTFGTLSTGALTATANADLVSTGALNLGSGTVDGGLTAANNRGSVNTGTGTLIVDGPIAITAVALTGPGKATSTLGSGAETLTLTNVLGGSPGAELFNTSVTGTLTVNGPDGNYFFAGNPPSGGVSVTSAGIHVFFNGVEITTSPATQQAGAARTSVSVSVLATVAEETKKSFGTDTVAAQIDYGFAGDVGVSAAMEHRVQEYGISVPPCFMESQRNIPCQ